MVSGCHEMKDTIKMMLAIMLFATVPMVQLLVP